MRLACFLLGFWLGRVLGQAEPDSLENRRLATLDRERRPECVVLELFG